MSEKYRIYIDEVGNSDLGSSENPNHRYLSLTGVVVGLSFVKTKLQPELEELKTEFFESHPDDPVVLHRKELLAAQYPFEPLHNPQVRSRFNARLLQLLSEWDYTLITVCLDKKTHKDTYSTWRYDPYHYCLAILLERYVFFLTQNNARGDVMAESRGGHDDKRLKESYSRLFDNGTDFVGAGQVQAVLTSRELKAKPKSANIAGLQLADIVAHPSRNEVLVENKVPGIRQAPFGLQIAERLQSKYYQRQGKVYGKKFI